MMVQETAFDGSAIVRFLRHLLRHIPGKVLLPIWVGCPLIMGRWSKTSSLKAQLSGFTWNDYPAMRRT
jgi:hypothetical protein